MTKRTNTRIVAIVQSKCQEYGLDPSGLIVQRLVGGMERYKREDGSPNHLQPEFNTLKEVEEETADAFAILSMAIERGEWGGEKEALLALLSIVNKIVIDLRLKEKKC